MYSHKTLLLFLALTVLTACQTKSVNYEVATVVRPMPPLDEHGKPQQYAVVITVTETGPDGEHILMRPQLITMVGYQAKVRSDKMSCTAFIEHENGRNRVDTSVSIFKDGKEVCSMKQSTILPLQLEPNNPLKTTA